MTHILIPIKDIESRITKLIGNKEKEAKYVWEDDEYLREQYPEAYELKQLLIRNKQISLNEEDIIQKAQTYTDKFNHRKPEITNAMGEAFIQALKDLS